jgi:CDK inhibitor PHO81
MIHSRSRKFGKQIQKRQLEVPEYAASFVNYKALKKVSSRSPSCPTLPKKQEIGTASEPY